MLLPPSNNKQIRIVYRLIEFSGGHDKAKNPLPYKEIYIYVLEVLPMFLAIAVFLIIHPGKVLVGPGAKMPGIWSMIKGKNTRGWREKARNNGDDDGNELMGRKYEELRGETGVRDM